MYERILFAVDDDEALPGALPVVAAFARRAKAAVRVVHVHRNVPTSANGASRQLVKAVTDYLKAAGVRAEGEIRLIKRGDKVASVIVRAAIQAEPDLVVIGSHGRSDLSNVFLGSVSHAVAAGLEAPVLIVRTPPHKAAEPGTVLIAVDGSRDSDQAVENAADVAAVFGAAVHVLHVQALLSTQAGAIVESDEESSAAVRRAREILESHGIQATYEVAVSQSVASTIAATAERIGAGLVALGSRRPSDVAGLLQGSVAHSVIHRLHSPVLLARHSRVAVEG